MEQIILFNSKSEMANKLQDRQIVQVLIDGQKFNLTRHGDQVIIFELKCPHFEYPLNQAKVNPFGEVVCPWHNYQFNLHSGEEKEDRCRNLWMKQATWNQESQCIIELTKAE
ncbi:MAG: Rieske 2Fe-2S domain-containing protein [Marinoscillum sp.]